MQLLPVALASILVAVAGPLGIILGWWLGRRGERERMGREERKSAYIDFVHALIRFRNATQEERAAIREERWAAFAEIVLVAPPEVVTAASYQITEGDRLLQPGLTAEVRQQIYLAMWERNLDFTRKARTDLRVGDANPFAGMQPVVGDHVEFQPLRGPATDERR